MRVWLASGSPRRRTILERLGFSVDVHPTDVDESLRVAEAAVPYALRLAEEKAAEATEEAVVLAADTVVHMGDLLLGKPVDRQDARQHLRTLSGAWHQVTTGVCVRRGADAVVFAVTTDVCFRELSDDEIDAYVATGEADDKAGSYGIQGLGGVLIAEVRGSWTNVMGLPAEAVVEPLAHRGAGRWL